MISKKAVLAIVEEEMKKCVEGFGDSYHVRAVHTRVSELKEHD